MTLTISGAWLYHLFLTGAKNETRHFSKKRGLGNIYFHPVGEKNSVVVLENVKNCTFLFATLTASDTRKHLNASIQSVLIALTTLHQTKA